jgi:hypothetical protein
MGEIRKHGDMKRILAGLVVFFPVASLLAQRVSPHATASATPNPADAAAVAATTAGIFGMYGACCLFEVLLFAACITGWIFLGFWIMNDAKSRQSENAQLVTILGWLVPVVGLIVHLSTRPNVNLVVCPNCKKKRIEGSAICPHCGKP